MSSPPPEHPDATRGAFSAALGYLIWGLVPLYWRQLTVVDPRELIAHRIVWSLVFLALILALRGGWAEIRPAFRSARSLGLNLLSSALLTVNWLVYVWAVNTGHVIECSLGYFLLPLLSVALGRIVLHEKLRAVQVVAIGCATAGVALQVVQVGQVPWIALALAGSFGFYGLIRKRSPLGSLGGLAVETALATPFAGAFLLWREHQGVGALGHTALSTQLLVLSAGVITSIPLLLFAYGARRIRLSTLGLLQYIAPTVQFALGVWVYHESFSRERAWSFVFIWIGLALYTAENLWTQRSRTRAAAPAS
jgi:chloramphenicol-sensitive protein RarD